LVNPSLLEISRATTNPHHGFLIPQSMLCDVHQTKGVCPCCLLLVQEFRGELSLSLTTYISIVYVASPGTFYGSLNPLFDWSRTDVDNCLYHAQFRSPLNTSVVPLEYLVNHFLDVLMNLRRGMFRVSPDFYDSTSVCFKGFLLTGVIA
jgi:hypothetical protein